MSADHTTAARASIQTERSNLGPIIIIAAFFFIFGFVTWLNGILIPYLRIACELKSGFETYLVTFAFYISYFVMAIPSSWVLERTGFRKGMSVGLIVMAVGALLFIPAAISRTYSLFLLGLFILGSGLAILQTASNPYITILGPIESAAKRISIMGICNKVAGVLSPLILGAIVLKDGDQFVNSLSGLDAASRSARLDELASRVIVPYLVMAGVLAGLAMLVRYANLPEVEAEEEPVTNDRKGRTSILQFPYLMLGVLAIFLYVGVEVIAGDTIISYGQWTGIGLATAKNFTSYTLIAMLVGYILGIILIPKYLKQETALRISAITGIIFSLLAISTSGFTSVMFIALLGLANSLMWPAIWPMAISGLGKFTKIGSSLLIMGIAGGALLPLLYGKLTDGPWNEQEAYWILVPCYVYILYYAVKGYKIGR